MNFRKIIFSINKKIIFKLSQVLLFAWLCGFIWYINQVKNFTNYNQKVTIADSIAVLTGGKERIAEGIKLFVQHKVQKMLISGVWKEVYLNQIAEIELHYKDIKNLEKNITLGRFAENTLENALETNMWMDLNQLKSVIVVTADYHMPRTKLIFDEVLKDKKIIYYPVTSKNFKINTWWDFPGTTKLIFVEYNKFILQSILNIVWYEYD